LPLFGESIKNTPFGLVIFTALIGGVGAGLFWLCYKYLKKVQPKIEQKVIKARQKEKKKELETQKEKYIKYLDDIIRTLEVFKSTIKLRPSDLLYFYIKDRENYAREVWNEIEGMIKMSNLPGKKIIEKTFITPINNKITNIYEQYKLEYQGKGPEVFISDLVKGTIKPYQELRNLVDKFIEYLKEWKSQIEKKKI